MNDPRGSLWRKWDLHVHTPCSIVQKFGGDNKASWERYFRELEALPSEYKVIGINDYIFVDGYRRILEARRAGRLGNLDLILPVIELRLDKFGGSDGHFSRVNFHVIFSDNLDPDIIQQHFLNALPRKYQLNPAYEFLKNEWNAIATRESLADLGKKIKESSPADKRTGISDIVLGFNNINFRLEDVLESLDSHYFKGKYFTAVGKNEWANIRWKDQSIADKKNIINTVDFVFTSANTIADCHKAKRSLVESAVNSRLLDCSDAHYFSESSEKERIGKCFTWIKADTTFEGLRQVYNEPDDRIYIGNLPDKLETVSANKTKYIHSISIGKKKDSTLDEIWFDNQVDFSHGLVAIVGNKGTGKSALADIIGLLGCTKNHQSFSFLNTKRFRQHTNNKAGHFEATLTWVSGKSVTKPLDSRIGPADVEMIKYIPQNFFENICNEIPGSEESDFDRELKEVIFSHVKEIDRLGRKSMEDLISYKTKETYEAIDILKSDLHQVNREVIDLENRSTQQYRLSLEKKLQVKREELTVHEESKPQAIQNPDIGPQSDYAKMIASLEVRKRELLKEIADIEALQNGIAILINATKKVMEQIENFTQRFGNFKEECLVELDQLGIRFESIAHLDINRTPILEKQSELFEERDKLNWLLNERNPQGPVYNLALIEQQINDLKSQMDQISKDYYTHQAELENWAAHKQEIIGDHAALDSLKYFERLLKELDHIPIELKAAYSRRADITKAIYARIKKLTQTYAELYRPIEEFVREHPLAKTKFSFEFDVSIIDVGFRDRFFDWISHAVTGSFCGVAQGKGMLESILERYDFNDESKALCFINEIMEHLGYDKRIPGKTPVNIAGQVKRGQTVQSLYDYIFSLEYLEPRYVLKMGGKELHQLSPGEKGAVLLVFYLLIDKDDIPLIIDQPEENLDNQTVYDLLVPFIKEAKRRRQIFIVTHNPNLAVVCDAEQIICASQDKLDKNRVTYISGAIENPTINKQILNILEGTRPAFDNRSSKYLAERV